MTGIYIRIQRNGVWVSAELDSLAADEWNALERNTPGRGWFFARGLMQWIKEHVQEA